MSPKRESQILHLKRRDLKKPRVLAKTSASVTIPTGTISFFVKFILIPYIASNHNIIHFKW